MQYLLPKDLTALPTVYKSIWGARWTAVIHAAPPLK